MRDEIDARAWNAHHEGFSAAIDTGSRSLARRLAAIDFGRAPAAHLIAALLATSLTLFTVGVTSI